MVGTLLMWVVHTDGGWSVIIMHVTILKLCGPCRMGGYDGDSGGGKIFEKQPCGSGHVSVMVVLAWVWHRGGDHGMLGKMHTGCCTVVLCGRFHRVHSCELRQWRGAWRACAISGYCVRSFCKVIVT